MPISSSDVSNIIGGQIGMFSASAQYAQAISAQYGFSPSGAPFGADPRSAGMAGGLASATARAPGMAMGGLGMMAMFNQAPRMLDPFTGSMHAASMGMRGGGGLAGGVGAGLGAMGAYAGIGAVGSWVTNQIATGAQNRSMTMGAAQNIMPNQGMQGLNAMAGQVEGMARQGMGSIRELTGVMQQGAMSGALDTSSLNQFSQSFQKLVSNVRQVAVALNSSITQAQQAMQQVKSIGISSDQAAGFLGTSRAFGATAGIGPQQMMGMAAGGAAFARQAGIDRSVGATGAITQAGIYGLAQQQGMPGIQGDSYGRYMQGASRFLMGSRGKAVLGAMMDPHTGGLDQTMATRMAGGFMSRDDIMSQSRQNMAGNADMFGSRRGELAATFMSQYGPQGVSSALGQMTSNSSRPGMLQQAVTGLNRSDLSGMKNLRSQTGALQSQLINAARQGFREGSQQQSFSSALGQAWEQFTKPIKDEFQQLGAQMTQAYGGAVDTMMGEFTRSRGVRFNPKALRQFDRNMELSPDFRQTQREFGAQMRGSTSYLSDASPGDNWAGAISSRMPSGFRIGRMSPGTQLSELPGYGLGTDSYSPMQSAMAGATAFAPGGRNIYGWAGHAVERAGAGIQALGGTPSSTGFMGMGGVGGPGSIMRGGGGLVRGVGFLGKGLGFASKVAAPAIIAADLLTNAGPAGMRAYGMSPISAGAVTGNEARMFRALTESGALGDEGFQDLQVGSLAGGIDQTPEGMTPLSGFVSGPSGGGGGTQRFITQKGMSQFQNIMSESGSKDALRKLKAGKGMGDKTASQATSGALKRAKAKAKSGGKDWRTMNSGDQLLLLTEELQKDSGEITTGDALAIYKDTPGAITDVTVAMHEQADPKVLLSNAGRNNRERRNLQQAYLLGQDTEAERGGQEASGLDPASRAGLVADLQKHRTGWLDLGGMAIAEGYVAGTSDTARDKQLAFLQTSKQMGGVGALIDPKYLGSREAWASSPKWHEQSLARENVVDERVIAASGMFGTPGAFAASTNQRGVSGRNTGPVRIGNTDFTPETGKIGVTQAKQHGMTSAILGGQHAMEFSTMVGRLRRGQLSSADFTAKMMGLDGYRASLGTRTGEEGEFDPYKYTQFLKDSAEGRGVAAPADAILGAEAAKSRQALRGMFGVEGTDEGNIRESQGDIAIRASGGSHRAIMNYRETQENWIKKTKIEGGEHKEGRTAARQQFIRNVQLRMAGGYKNADTDAVTQATEAGGAMNMDDAQQLYDDLMTSDNPVHRDMAASLGNFMEARNVTRTKSGKKRGFDKVLKGYGVKLSREDKSFARGKSDIMSTDLENDLRKMATQALQAQFGKTPSPAEVTARTRDLVGAIKSDDGDKWEELVSTQGAPGGVSQGGTGKRGALTAQATEFSGAMGAATKAAQDFAKLIPK
jgi:hypothetical protein